MVIISIHVITIGFYNTMLISIIIRVVNINIIIIITVIIIAALEATIRTITITTAMPATIMLENRLQTSKANTPATSDYT